MNSYHGANMSWLLDDFAARVPGVRHAVTVSADGLRIAATSQLPEDRADQLAAITSGLVSLADGAARAFQTAPVEQTIIEMAGGYLFVMAISDGSHLAVLADDTCDMGKIAYDMTALVDQVGQSAFTPEIRGAPLG